MGDLIGRIGAVVIGRNEGERLAASLDSVASLGARVVYVDSGSTDGSPTLARRRGVDVLELDPARPFGAARARNEGYAQLRAKHPGIRYVQFVDGDSALALDWLEAGAHFLEGHPDSATVCGRLRERHPDASVYQAVCDIEWDIPPGESQACGGNIMFRADAFDRAGGFREDLRAGEESELARRLTGLGWRHWRIAGEMALHDADIRQFSEWWRRTVRNGYGFAQGFDLGGPGRLWSTQLRSTWLWAVVVPLVIAVAVALEGPIATSLLLAYPLQVVRLALRSTRSAPVNWYNAILLVIGKFAQLTGHLAYLRDRFAGRVSPA
jgi:glycosyltransferase involved in cell wall biosynthesis